MPETGDNTAVETIKRLVLVADDELVNREMLGMVLSDSYEVVYACDGRETLAYMREYGENLSLVLLDLNMPHMSGFEVLEEQRKDPEFKNIPVIVVTADQESEVKSLGLGAVDFIPKPFPRADIIIARVQRTIELYEDRAMIAYTERDPVTNLYNRDYFFRHAMLFDQYNRGVETDAIIVDVNRFHILNERLGSEGGDAVLRDIGLGIRDLVRASGGIVCRQGADTFLVYCPHIEDCAGFLESVSARVNAGLAGESVHLRMGVYPDADKQMEVRQRFDRAKMAADTVKGSFTKAIGTYDSELHEKERYAERLINDFRAAIDERQFTVFFQPKFDIRSDKPKLTSAEALVRWIHPELGMISPGIFVPLFEDNGLIQALDRYVWQEAARQIRDWKRRFATSLPVSVNVSRIDMYDPELIPTLQAISDDNDLDPGELLLEITESAYTQDSKQIIDTVNQLRDVGFRIEMDDFGTGYSSLNMISELPIDALKLDMQFIRSAFSGQKDTRLIEVIIDIADYLSVPVIAEGVETEEQLGELKQLGCDIVQGFYFSKPIPAAEFEEYFSA